MKKATQKKRALTPWQARAGRLESMIENDRLRIAVLEKELRTQLELREAIAKQIVAGRDVQAAQNRYNDATANVTLLILADEVIRRPNHNALTRNAPSTANAVREGA